VAWRRRRDPADVFTGLRSQILELDPTEVVLQPTEELPNAWGGLMELGYPEGAATIVCLADGTTSMYTSTGGGVIGGGAHESVVQASRGFLVELEGRLSELEEDGDPDLPAPGIVAFRALTYSVRLARSADEDELASGHHPLSSLYAAGQDVITALREIEEAGA
jgi:hypothetical protein